MTTLYTMRNDYARLLDRLYDEDMDEQTLIDTLDSIEGAIEEKADSYAMVIGELAADEAKIDAEIKRLQGRKKTLQNHQKTMKGNLMAAMKAVGKPKFKTSLYSFNIAKAGGKRALVLDVDVDKLPGHLQSVTIGANNDALRAFLGDAESCEYCHLAEQGESLRIK